MTPTRRIFLNIITTYGRSLYALVIGLFCGRWTLMALGEVDYGLLGVVGGMAAFVAFFNGIMASGVGRFYAICVGKYQGDSRLGLEKCREWFSTAVAIHTILPIVLVLIGYPIGAFVVRHCLSIPPERLFACLWVWRFSCISCFISMASVPYHAMYEAQQDIAELTIYSFVTTTLNVFFMYFAVTHPGEWLVGISFWICLLTSLPALIISFRAFRKYPECRFRLASVNCMDRVKRMLAYSGWFVIGNAAQLLRDQGMGILVNLYYGPRVNAAQGVGGTLSNHCSTLSASLTGAFWPVITTAYGAGDMDRVREYVYRVSRLATIFVMIFALPLILEIDEVLVLWLKNPPCWAAGLCICSLIGLILDKTSFGYAIAAHACEKIAKYQMAVGGINLLAIPLALLGIYADYNVYWIGAVVAFMCLLVACMRVLIARRMFAVSGRYWLFHIVLPLLVVSAAAGGVGLVPRLLLSAGFVRVLITLTTMEFVLLPSIWFVVFSPDERAFVVERIQRFKEWTWPKK